MLPVRHAVPRTTVQPPFVCLTCRLKTQRRLRHASRPASTLDTNHTVGLHGLESEQDVHERSSEVEVPPGRPWQDVLEEPARTVPIQKVVMPSLFRKLWNHDQDISKSRESYQKDAGGYQRDESMGHSHAENAQEGRRINIRTFSARHGREAQLGEYHYVGRDRVINDVRTFEPPSKLKPTRSLRRGERIKKHLVADRRQIRLRKQWGTPWLAKVKDEAKKAAVISRTRRNPLRKQWGTPWLAKLSDEVNKAKTKALDDVLDGHIEAPRNSSNKALASGKLTSADLYDANEGLETRRNGSVLSTGAGTHGGVTMRWAASTSSSGPNGLAGGTRMRQFHNSARSRQQAAAIAAELYPPPPPPDLPPISPRKPENPNGIRAQLRKWQELHGSEDPQHDQVSIDTDTGSGDVLNNLTRLPSEGSVNRSTQAEEEEDEKEAMAHFVQAPSDEPSPSEASVPFLRMGDLVEIEYTLSERESLVAVFVRRAGRYAQFYTMQGRWVHLTEKKVQYSIPGWISADAITPLLDHLPTPEDVETNLEELMDTAYVKDLSVPRHVAAPLVSRLVQFHAESQAIYRKHASTLDNAHNILAHDTDLRYGSLVSAATTLLNTPADQLSVTALYAVRQAMTHAGFAFNIDRRSHRLTGYLQIRSKEQVKMVEQVRRWLREWQDDLALTATMDEQQLRKHRTTRGARIVRDFIEKARKIVLKSREDRQPTPHGSVGPSKVRLPITPESDCVRITTYTEFTEEDTELVRFLEAWALSSMFDSLPRVQSLPPLILQATGLYEGMPSLTMGTGLVFLQELGTIMPYENRVRFDQHLLLPSSQHSKPLQALMSSLLDMQKAPNFNDSMADLRHDWANLPVYCIDAAGAHEIDDGMSIEPAATTADGKQEWWVHIHIANPTAFFSRDHPLAKMARHMGETIYMPERTYMMLPRWSTQRHFSLAKNRPVLTFSARMDDTGRTLERKITPGVIRNVFRLTPEEVSRLLGLNSGRDDAETVLTVGGEVPAASTRKSEIGSIDLSHVQQLKTLSRLAEMRQDIRKNAGGLFFDSHKPEVSVWQSYKASGLGWDHPYRRGSRRVEGDPVIQMRTRGLTNWFAPQNDAVDVLVREHMLLACEVAATWCEERQIPAVFRGSVPRPDKMDSGVFFRDILTPASRQNNGEIPMHVGMRYLETFGNTVLSTKPFRHRILGMDHYGKVTSPLRRYGDMIVHWQIEAALRQEATTGKSLITDEPAPDRSFLPFSTAVLNTVIVGLQPRESIIMKAKQYAEYFWMNMLLFRAHHFNETTLPWQTLKVYCQAANMNEMSLTWISCIVKELNITASMLKPEASGLGGARQGDVWECTIESVDCYRRILLLKPLRLLERVD